MARSKVEEPETVEEVETLSTLEEAIDDLGSEAQSLSAKVRRLARSQDKGVAGVNAGFIGSLDPLNAYTVEHDLEEMGGGGRFALDLYVNGHRLKDEDGNGVTRVVVVDGNAHPKREVKPEAPPVAAPVAPRVEGPTPRELELEAKLARMEERDRERERAQEKAEDRAALAQLVAQGIASAVAPLAARLDSVSQQPIVQPRDPIDELAKLRKMDRDELKAVDSPATLALKAQLEAQAATTASILAKLDAQERERTEEKHARERARLEEKHEREIERRDALIEDLRAENAETMERAHAKPKNEMLSALADTALLTAGIDKIFAAGRDPDAKPRTSTWQKFIEKNGDRVAQVFTPMIEERLEAVLASVTTPAPRALPGGVPQTQENPAEFMGWLQGNFDPSASRDMENIRVASIRWPDHMNRLASLRDQKSVADFLVSVGFQPALVHKAVPENWPVMERWLNDLRATLVALKAAASAPAAEAEAKKPKPPLRMRPRVEPPRGESDEDSEQDDDEDEGDAEDDDQDEDEEDEGGEDEDEGDESEEADDAEEDGGEPEPGERSD